MKEQIEILKNKQAANPLDIDVEEKEEPIIEVVDIDHCKMIMQEYEDNKTWIEEFMKTIKPNLQVKNLFSLKN